MVGAGGITLPDRSFYLEDQPHYEAARSLLVNYANRLLKLAGVEAGYDAGKAILDFETSLAECMWPREMMREVARTYNPMSFDELQDSATSFQWSAFLEEFGFPSFDHVVVAQPDYLPNVVPALYSAAAAFAEDSAAGPERWKARGFASWGRGNATLNLAANYSSSYAVPEWAAPQTRVENYMTLDLTGSYEFGGSGWKLYAGARNITNREFPFFNGLGGDPWDPRRVDTRDRVLYFEIR